MEKVQVSRSLVNKSFRYVICVGYCEAQYLLQYREPNFYTYSTVNGWNADVYVIDHETVIVTGLRSFGNVDGKNAHRFDVTAMEHGNMAAPYEKRKKEVEQDLRNFVTVAVSAYKSKDVIVPGWKNNK